MTNLNQLELQGMFILLSSPSFNEVLPQTQSSTMTIMVKQKGDLDGGSEKNNERKKEKQVGREGSR